MGLTVGINIGGTKIAAGVVDEGGRILARQRVATGGRDAEKVEQTVADLILQLREEYDIEAVGLGAAGFVDETRPGRALRAEPRLGRGAARTGGVGRVRAARGGGERRERGGVGRVPLRRRARHATTWSRSRSAPASAAASCSTTSSSAARYGMAAEFGHLVRVPDGRLCGCGKRGCWEQYASGNALLRKARDLAAERRGEAAPAARPRRRHARGRHRAARHRGGARGRPGRARGVPTHRHLARARASPTSRRCSTRRCSSSAAVSEAGDLLLASTGRRSRSPCPAGSTGRCPRSSSPSSGTTPDWSGPRTWRGSARYPRAGVGRRTAQAGTGGL